MKIILASQSPRRRELLERMGISEFEIIPARGEENIVPGLTPEALVEALSRQKCLEVAAVHREALVIAADTVVAVEGRVLGKPRSKAEAEEMLSLLSGREHRVCTGLSLSQGGRLRTGHEATAVRFRPLTREEIRSYVSTGEPMDKAGAYGIQRFSCLLDGSRERRDG